MNVDRYLVDNKVGWRLALARHTADKPLTGRPVLIIPGYGMNSYIFDFHPKGPSMVQCLAARGLEVWTLDLRDQGRSVRGRGNKRYGIAELAHEDIGAAVGFALANTKAGAKELDLVGCSLGTALAFTYVALEPKPPIGKIVSMAGLVTWKDAHPLVRLAFGSPRAAGLFRMKNTRRLARLALPLVAKVAPGLLSLYINDRTTDLTQSEKMVQTVEDPHPIINREIAEWMRRGDLIVRGVNVSARLPGVKNPFMCVVANHDGIVLPATSRHTFDVIGSEEKELLLVGEDDMPVAHADLFLCTGAQERVFAPVADFLLRA